MIVSFFFFFFKYISIYVHALKTRKTSVAYWLNECKTNKNKRSLQLRKVATGCWMKWCCWFDPSICSRIEEFHFDQCESGLPSRRWRPADRLFQWHGAPVKYAQWLQSPPKWRAPLCVPVPPSTPSPPGLASIQPLRAGDGVIVVRLVVWPRAEQRGHAGEVWRGYRWGSREGNRVGQAAVEWSNPTWHHSAPHSSWIHSGFFSFLQHSCVIRAQVFFFLYQHGIIMILKMFPTVYYLYHWPLFPLCVVFSSEEVKPLNYWDKLLTQR